MGAFQSKVSLWSVKNDLINNPVKQSNTMALILHTSVIAIMTLRFSAENCTFSQISLTDNSQKNLRKEK